MIAFSMYYYRKYAYVDFLPPNFNVKCLTNGNVVLHWSVQSSGNLSSDYIDNFVKSWSFTGSCKNRQGDVYQVNHIYCIVKCNIHIILFDSKYCNTLYDNFNTCMACFCALSDTYVTRFVKIDPNHTGSEICFIGEH